MAGILLSQIIASNYIKYERLTRMVNAAFAGSSATKINIFIDINSIMKPMFSSNYSTSTKDEDTSIAAHLINMIAHYRRFFRTRYKVESDVYLVYSNNINDNNLLFVPGYNNKMIDIIKLQRDKVNNLIYNLDILEKICPYLPDTCYLYSKFESSVVMNNIMNKISKPDIPNIVISRDIYATQLAAIRNDTIIFRPKKNKQQDESFYIGKSINGKGGCIQNFIDSNNVSASSEGLNDELLSFIMAMSKLPERNIKTIISLPKAISLTRDIVSDGRHINGYNSCNNISDIYMNFPDKEKIQCIHGNVEARFKAIDIIYQDAIYSNSIESYNFKGIQNLYDPKSIHMIANEYFKINPLDLENL